MNKFEGYTVKMLLTKVFNWAYEHDVDLYKNLDYAFGAFEMRSGIEETQQKLMKEVQVSNSGIVYELLKQAISIADYQDVIKFKQAFVFHHESTNKAHYTQGWKYDSFTPYPYSSLIEDITKRMGILEEKGTADWHISDNHDKHSHFRFWMNEFLRDDKRFSLRLFVVNSGNTRCFDTVHVGTNESWIYYEIVHYILNNNIVPDPHHTKIDVPDFVNPDNHNERYITRSGRHGGFWYLVYLTAKDLQEIYETRFTLNEEKMNSYDEPFWAFINAFPKDQHTKFYLFFT